MSDSLNAQEANVYVSPQNEWVLLKIKEKRK